MPNPRHPSWRHEMSHSPAPLLPDPTRATPARKSVHCGVGVGTPRPHTPRLKGVQSGGGECATPDTPHESTSPPPLAPSCGPRRAQPKLAAACAVGLVTGPKARIPRAQGKGAAGSGRTPQGRAVGEGVCNAGHPSQRYKGPPHRRPPAAPTAHNAISARACAVGSVTVPDACTPCSKRRGERAPAARLKDGPLGEGECPTPDNPRGGRGGGGLGALLPPRQLTTPARKSVRCRVGDWPPGPHLRRPTKKGSGFLLHNSKTGSSGRENAQPRTPLTEAPGALSQAPSCRHHSAQKLLARLCAVWLVKAPHARTPLCPLQGGSRLWQHAPRTAGQGR